MIRQRKIAISLAVVGAVAAPFFFHTYKMQYPYWRSWTMLTEADKHQIETNLARCTPSDFSDQGSVCNHERTFLEHGGYYAPKPSVVAYLLVNVVVAIASFAALFFLTYLVPALARRYWSWLNT